MSGWILLGAVLVGLIPIILVVLSGVRSLEAGGVKVAFAAVQEVVLTSRAAGPGTRLADNLGQPAGISVPDTSGDTIIAALRDALVDDVVVVDLKEGQAWWGTRLMLLIAGATRLGYPKAMAFTATVPERPRKFVGWATSGELLRRYLDSDPILRKAYDAAERGSFLWKLSSHPLDEKSTLPWAVAGQASKPKASGDAVPPMGEETGSDRWLFSWPSPFAQSPPWVRRVDEFLPERLLLAQLQEVESELDTHGVSAQNVCGNSIEMELPPRANVRKHWAPSSSDSRRLFTTRSSIGPMISQTG